MESGSSRYQIFEAIASGGMGTVHLARLNGPAGFSRVLAVKKLHEKVIGEADHALMLLDEARLTGRIRSSFVVPTIDVVLERDNIMVVMEYVLGESLGTLLRTCTRRGERVPPDIAVAVLGNALSGLHAAHELADDEGQLLGLVHRDVSPQNVLVGADGIARVLDFGIAKALGRSQTTGEGQVKGKVAYMSPEQMRGEEIDCRSDVFSATIVLWEVLTGLRLFGGTEMRQTVGKLLVARIPSPAEHVPGLSDALCAVVMKGLERERSERYATALEMAQALEAAVVPAPSSRVASWMASLMGAEITQRRARLLEIERTKTDPISESGKGAVRAIAASAEGRAAEEGQTQTDTTSSASVDVQTDMEVGPQKKSKRWPFIAVLGLSLLAFGAFFGVRAVRDSARLGQAEQVGLPGKTVQVAAIPSTSASANPISLEPTTAAIASASTASTAPTSTSVASTPNSASTGSSGKPNAQAGVALSKKAHDLPRAKPTAAVDCSTPFFINENGEKKYKRECLR
jgi:eukaryotic-like serine/threonine-protein kinase